MASAICRSPSLCNLALLDVQVTGVEETQTAGKIQYAFCLDLQWSDYRRDVVWRNYYEFVELHNALLSVFKEYSKPRPGRQPLPTIPAIRGAGRGYPNAKLWRNSEKATFVPITCDSKIRPE
ncbi:hypothetical protein Bbelb_312200 [Branchiostoma belcheri]|nr:hypothetical protein Bbelb_312200 [Branchiostoma belcheri]